MATTALFDDKEPLPSKAANITGSERAALGSTPASKRFPERLFDLLNAEAAPRSLYWLPGGKAFAIEQESFAPEILDRYFQATKFASFVRRLHKWYVTDSCFSFVSLYVTSHFESLQMPRSSFLHFVFRGFRRETRGFRKEIGPELSRSVIAFSHDHFQKDAPHRLGEMEEVARKYAASPPRQRCPAPARPAIPSPAGIATGRPGAAAGPQMTAKETIFLPKGI